MLIENAPGSGDTPREGSGARVRAALGLAADTPVVLYTGTFEAYQGLDLLFAAARVVAAARPDARFVLAGGRPEQIEQAQGAGARRGRGGSVVFAGQRPAEEIPEYLDAADVLVSPRSHGTNTPLKIYQYLRSGRPIVATRLAHAHAGARRRGGVPDAGDAGRVCGGHPGRARRSRARARSRRAGQRLAETKYSYEAYLNRTRQACGYLAGGQPARIAGDVV